MKRLLKNKKVIVISAGVIILIIIFLLFLFLKKENKVLKEEFYTLYLKVNPLVKIEFVESYYICKKEICSDYETKVSKLDLINDDAKKIYNIVNVKNESIDKAINELILVYRNKKQMEEDLLNIKITTNWKNYRKYGLQTKLTDEKTNININYLKKIDEEKILKEDNLEEFDIVFDSDGGTEISSQKITIGENALEPNTPLKDGFIFEEWQLNEEKYDFTTPVNNNIVLIAKWKKIENQSVHIVNFNSNGGTLIANKTVLDGETINKPINPTKDGYTFVEWQLNGKKYNFNNKINSDITLIAIWKSNSGNVSKKTYTVTFNSNGGSQVSNSIILEGETVSKPTNPTRNGYTFVEWQLNGKKYNFNNKINNDITLIAIWKSNNNEVSKKNYTVTFESNGGSNIAPVSVTEGNCINKPNDPTKDGYIFKNWTLNGKNYDFLNECVTKNIVLVANWIEIVTPKLSKEVLSVDNSSGNVSLRLNIGNLGAATGVELFSLNNNNEFNLSGTFANNIDLIIIKGMKNSYKIRNYYTINGKKYYSEFSNIVEIDNSVIPTIGISFANPPLGNGSYVFGIEIKNPNEISKIYGIEIFESKDGSYYNLLKDYTVSDLQSQENTIIVTNESCYEHYYIKARSYIKINGWKKYSDFSSVLDTYNHC